MAKGWYILHVFSGYEKRIEKKIRRLIADGEIPDTVVFDVKVPEETITEVKDGKKKESRRLFLPGYLMVQMDLPDAWQKTCAALRSIDGVTGFASYMHKDRPSPITNDEAQNLLQKTGDLVGVRPSRSKQSFKVGESVKITEGAFAAFTGTIDSVDDERNKLKVMVAIFGRTTPVEVDWLQVEKV